MKNAKNLTDRLRDMQRDPEYRAAVAKSKHEAEITFWGCFLASMCVLSVVAYLWGEPVWNMFQTLGDFEAPGSIGYLFCTLLLAVMSRKMVGLNFFTD